MADLKLVEILRQGSEVWNRWQEQQLDDMKIDLSKADLSGAKLGGANLYRADLHGANLSRANLNGVDLSSANLRGAYLAEAWLILTNLSRADLTKSELTKADLIGTNLSEANLSEAELIAASLNGANLSGTNLTKAVLGGTIIAQIDLSTTQGLISIFHHEPSYVELFSVQLPQDGSALHFLRGCGVPDEWIDDYHARRMYPIHYHSCFISYSNKDETLARRLHADLQDQGVRCWFAPEDLKIGDKIRSRIDEAIHLQDKLLLLLSDHALASDWVEVEVEAALEKEQDQGREVLFPVRLDESVMQATQAWAKQLRRARHIGDFTQWTDPQAYEQAFDRLLRDLKA